MYLRQYLHLTVCLMMGSLEKHWYSEARPYSEKPTPAKLMSRFKKKLPCVPVSSEQDQAEQNKSEEERLTHTP